jgi:hypothetical protein
VQLEQIAEADNDVASAFGAKKATSKPRAKPNK